MNNIANKAVICDVLLQAANKDKNIVVLCSDSRGSGSMTAFANSNPTQFIEVGIAEQNLVAISAGLASCGKKTYAVSPASFLSTRSMEQVKVDVAYSNTNVKLVGISGGISYGSLGATHHSVNDIAIMSSIANMRVYLPSDRFQTKELIEKLLQDKKPAYIRVGRNAVEDVYTDGKIDFTLDKATVVTEGNDIAIIACGEMVSTAKVAADQLQTQGIKARVLDMYCLKPLDRQAIQKAAEECKGIITIEEHSCYGGLGSLVCSVVAQTCFTKVKVLALPDEPIVSGKSPQIFAHYGLNSAGIIAAVKEILK